MNIRNLSPGNFICLLALSVFCTSASALPVMDMSAEVIMRQASDMKDTLNLSPNQKTLWEQSELKAKEIFRNRSSRRSRLQEDAKATLNDQKAELRDLAKKLSAEIAASNQENTDLQELFLTMNDALDDHQRQLVIALLADELQRQADPKKDSITKPKEDDQGHHGSRKRSGAMNGGSFN